MSFPRYPKYKDSGVEWLGEVPAHWDVRTVISLLRESPCYGVLVPDFDPAGVPMLRITDIEAGIARREELTTITQRLSDEYRRTVVAAGDVVLSVVGTIGEVLKVDPTLQGANLSRALARLQPATDLNADFACWALRSDVFVRYVDLVCVGTAQRVLNMDDLRSMRFAIPAPEEQTTIATFLDRETARIDALVAEQQRLIELLNEKRQAVISHAVTKGLNPDAQMKDSGVEWLGKVPAHWEMKRLKHISPFITVGIVVNPSTFTVDDGLPFIYGGDIREGVIDWENARRIDADSTTLNAKTILHAGDLLTVRVGAPGVTAVVPKECEGGNCASVMLVRRGEFNSDWLCFAMNTRIVRFQVEVVQYGAAQEQFNISHAVNFWVPTPPRAEQDEIAALLASEAGRLDALTAEAQRAVDLLQERRTALISAAITGQIDVRNAVARSAA